VLESGGLSLDKTMTHCGIVPPYILRAIVRNGTPRQQLWAWSTLTDSEQFRGQRKVLSPISAATMTGTGRKRRTVYDARHGYDLPGRLVRSEGDARSKDPAVNEAYDGCGATYDFFWKVFGRNSIDARGLRLESTVHYGRDYDNAFWDGRQIVFGDGDGEIFGRFTRALDVIGHELSHGVVQFEAGLKYHGQPGALSESLGDVFGSMVKQYKKRQSAAEADWLIGGDLLMPGIKAAGIRSMRAPGTAYDDPLLGRDPQPAHMRDYIRTSEDNGGVHLNSGIPNRAFYGTAVRLGGRSWDKAGRIWYAALQTRVRQGSTFRDAMNMTVQSAGDLFGGGSEEQKAVREAWAEVGL
jgi:Zn-dependent metalloprotease